MRTLFRISAPDRCVVFDKAVIFDIAKLIWCRPRNQIRRQIVEELCANCMPRVTGNIYLLSVLDPRQSPSLPLVNAQRSGELCYSGR